jgi:outer membrane protein insertion porin family
MALPPILTRGTAIAFFPRTMERGVRNRLVAILVFAVLAAGLSMAPALGQAAPAPARTSAQESAPVPARRALELEKITIAGNSYVSDTVILETLGLAPGDTVNAGILEDARLRLLREHHLLESVEFSTRPGSRRGLVILDIAIKEKRPVILETGFGYQDIYGWFLTLLGVRIEPGFAGGTHVGLGLRLGFHITGLDGEVERHAPTGGFGYGANFHIYSQKQIFFEDVGAPPAGGDPDLHEMQQKIDRAGAELYLLYGARERTRFTFGLKAESVKPESSFVDSDDDVDHSLADFPAAVRPEIENTVITGLFFRVVRDTRDRLDYPRAGSFSILQMQTNNTYLGGDEIYAKAELDFRKHVGLGGWRVLSTRLAAGVASEGAPYYERFYLGGIYSVRGFRELSLSPPSGNDGYMIASEELRVPLVTSAGNAPRLTGLLFVDAGLGWERGVKLRASDIQAAAGYGVRLRLPWIGTLGLDAGIPFTDGRTGDKFYVHGALGFSF